MNRVDLRRPDEPLSGEMSVLVYIQVTQNFIVMIQSHHPIRGFYFCELKMACHGSNSRPGLLSSYLRAHELDIDQSKPDFSLRLENNFILIRLSCDAGMLINVRLILPITAICRHNFYCCDRNSSSSLVIHMIQSA